MFRPVATDVKGEKRFLSTIARRLDTLGAITRGQRQTGGQGLFRADDNLESPYAKAALRQFYQLRYAGKIDGCSLGDFQDAAGLDLVDQDGSLKEELPPITQFLNRILALRIAMQNLLFAAFEQLLEAAIVAGTYDIGVETLTAESFRVVERRTVHTHAATGAETRCYRVLRKDRNRPLFLAEALALRADNGRLVINEQTRRAAVQMHAASLMDDDGNVEIRTRLIRPMTRETISVERFNHSHWRKATREEFAELWEAECERVPEFSESAFHIIAGLLLPIWDRLPADSMRVYRFETDDGERVIGRLVTPEVLDRFYQSLGVNGAPTLSDQKAWDAVIERGAVLERELHSNEQAQRRGQAEQDGSEVKSVELERLIGQGISLIKRRNAFEFVRDHAAELYEATTGSSWRPHTGSMVNHRALTAAVIDSREFLAARHRADAQVLAPAGARIAFTGGTDCNDHARIWEALDKIRTKHPNMVLLHGGSLHGAERIATCWAENRKVANSSQIGRGAATPRPSSAPIACSRLCRLGATVFAGSGISDNLTDKAKKPGIPLWHFDGDGPA